MSTRKEESFQPRSNHPRYVLRYTCSVDGGDSCELFAEGVAHRGTRSVLFGDEPKLEVAYDPSRHLIQISQEGEDTAEFDDRPARFLCMDRDPTKGKIAPVLERGSPVYTTWPEKSCRRIRLSADVADGRR